MEILKNQKEPLDKTNKIANQVAKEQQSAPATKADLYPEDIKKRRKCTISEAMIKTLVRQLGAELSNYHLYRTFSAYYQRIGLPKLGIYYLERANEENVHHNWIFNYLTECDADFQYPKVEAINVDITDNVLPFRLTVDREIETTQGINQIVNQAVEEGDWSTFQMLNGDDPDFGRLVREQVNYFCLKVQ